MKRKVILYGCGNMGMAAAGILLRLGCSIACFIDRGISSDKSIEIDGHVIRAIHPEDLDRDEKRSDVLVSMAADTVYTVSKYLGNLGCEHVYPAGDYIQGLCPEKTIANVWHLSSEQNKCVQQYQWDDADSALQWRIACEWFSSRSEKTMLSQSFYPDREKYITPFIRSLLRRNDVMVDSAFLNGEFAEKFIAVCEGTVHAFQLHPNLPVAKNSEKVHILDTELFSCNASVKSVRTGLMHPFDNFSEYEYKTIRLDDYSEQAGIIPAFLRVYSMSEAYPILLGAQQTIIEHRPIIAVNIGHYLTDLIQVPIFIQTVCRHYTFLFRVHSFQGNDCILYAIPSEKAGRRL